MAGVRISSLPSGGELQSNDLIPVSRGTTTFSVRGEVIFPITEPKLGTNSVSNRSLGANVVSLDKIITIAGNRVLGNNSGSQGNVAAVQVNESMIADGAVTSVKIAPGTITGNNLLTNSITLNKLQQISANRVLGAVVDGNVIQTQITNGMIASNAITSDKIGSGQVKRANIEDFAINRDKIASNEVMFSNIQQIGSTTNSVIGYTSANTNAQAIKISPNFLSLGAPSWNSDGTLTTTGLNVNNNTFIQNTCIVGTSLTVGTTLAVNFNSNILNFTSVWSGTTQLQTNIAEISNDTGTYKTLMIVGNRSNDAGVRRVSVWDRLDVNGSLYVSGDSDVVPTGCIMAFAHSGVPTGWLYCNGAGISTTTYSRLFAKLGYYYGGSGGTFNIPDYRNIFLRGTNGLNINLNLYQDPYAGYNTYVTTTDDGDNQVNTGDARGELQDFYVNGTRIGFGSSGGGRSRRYPASGEYVVQNQPGDTRPANRGVNYYIKF